jgi:hypothetical protein
MVLADVTTLVSLLSLGGIIGAAGFLRLSRLDRLRWEHIRQSACRWHRWQILEGGTSLMCTLCGKKSRRINPLPDSPLDETISSGNILPP